MRYLLFIKDINCKMKKQHPSSKARKTGNGFHCTLLNIDLKDKSGVIISYEKN